MYWRKFFFIFWIIGSNLNSNLKLRFIIVHVQYITKMDLTIGFGNRAISSKDMHVKFFTHKWLKTNIFFSSLVLFIFFFLLKNLNYASLSIPLVFLHFNLNDKEKTCNICFVFHSNFDSLNLKFFKVIGLICFWNVLSVLFACA